MKKKVEKQIWHDMFLNYKNLLTLFTLILISGMTQAQTNKVSIVLKDTTIEAVISEIRKQTDADFIYNHEEISKCEKISIHVNNVTIEEALDISLKNTNFSYKKVNSTYVIVLVKKTSEIPEHKSKIQTQTLRGRVIDQDSKVSLPFANVVILNTNPRLGTTTDTDGYFKIEELPVGRYSVKVSYVGYEEAVVPEILVGSAKEVILNIEIAEKTETLDEVYVSIKKGEALNEMATISAKSFSVEETKRYAASISDPARMAQVFAGVSTNDDASNEIVIRGNSPNWMLWRLEGVEIPSPNHFAEEGYSSGAVSILSTNMLGKSDFYTGAFSAEYGNALSGVFDLKLRNGNNEEREYSLQAGLLGVELSAEGPFKIGYRGSYLLNYRYSTFSLMNNLNIEVSENALPNYQDLAFKINLPTRKAGTFSIWGIGGNSDVDEKFFPDTSLGQKFEHGYSDYTITGMYATGLKHVIYPDKKSYISTVISHSKSYSSETYNIMDSTGILHNELYDNLKRQALWFTTFYNRKFSSKLTARAGFSINLLDYNYISKLADSLYNWNTTINGSGNTNLYQGYVQSKYKILDHISFTAGLHYTHFKLNKENSIEPRFGLEISLKNQQKLSFGYGYHSKTENLPVYFVEFEDSLGNISYLHKNLKLTHSAHYIMSYQKMFNQSLAFKTEVYYQHITKLPVPNNTEKLNSPAFGSIYPHDTLESTGIGRNYGIEFTLQKYFTNNYYFLITSSLFESKYKPSDGIWYNTKYNINYINNFVGGKEILWSNNKMLSINGKILWSGGKRIIPIDLEASKEEGEAVYDSQSIFSKKAKDYFRVDLGVKIHFYKQKTEHIIMLDIQNVTNRLNTWSEIYDAENEAIIDYPMAGLIPIVSYRVEF